MDGGQRGFATVGPQLHPILLTGGIGSGKSEVGRILSSMGYGVYDSDSRAKELYRTSVTLIPRLEDATGRRLRDSDGIFRPHLLSQVVFSSPDMLRRVEAIVHPEVKEDFGRWKGSLECDGSRPPLPLCFMESAIALSKPLFRGSFDAVLMVEAPLGERIRRCMLRDDTTEAKVLSRVRAQVFPEPSCPLVRVENDSTTEDLVPRVEEALSRLAALLGLGEYSFR